MLEFYNILIKWLAEGTAHDQQKRRNYTDRFSQSAIVFCGRCIE